MCSYELTVIARDRSDEPRSSNATIFVTVRDENDNPPVILNITSGVTMVPVEEVKLIALITCNITLSHCCIHGKSHSPHTAPHVLRVN